MKPETFFANFEQFSDAPDAVAKMRRFILDLAVRGKLVEQAADDEPASALLERIQRERTRLVKVHEIKKQEPLTPATKDGISFPLPSGWAPTQLGDVAICLDYMREPINGAEREIRIAGKSRSELFPYYGATQQQGWIDDYIFDAELVLLGEDGVPFFDELRPKAYLISGKTWVNNHAHVFRGILVSNSFLMHSLNTFDYTGRVAGSTRSKLNQAKALDIPIALPPLAEQKRIVVKVEELMALCDRLEAQQKERKTRHTALARAALSRFADAPTSANLTFLFHKSYTIPPADLRKSILTLAVRGKLVPQDPNDEPAIAINSRLPDQLRAIANRVRARFSATNALVQVDDNLPPGWGVAAIQSIGVTQTGTTPSKSESSFSGRDVPFIKPGDIQGDEVDYENEGLSVDGLEAGRLIPKDSILMVSIGGSIGKTAIVEREVSCNQQINIVTVAECIAPRFVLTAIRSSDFQNEVLNRAAQGTLPIISKGKWETIQIPIPPLAEQRRIVAKVDELMTLVDALETQLAASRATAAKLLDAIVGELTA